MEIEFVRKGRIEVVAVHKCYPDQGLPDPFLAGYLWHHYDDGHGSRPDICKWRFSEGYGLTRHHGDATFDSLDDAKEYILNRLKPAAEDPDLLLDD